MASVRRDALAAGSRRRRAGANPTQKPNRGGATERAVDWRRRLLVLAVLVSVCVAGYLVWFRDLPLFAVRDVEVTGLTTSQDSQIEHEFERVARGMTTLHVREDTLGTVAGRYPVVESVSADAGFPRTLRITVVERPPVAAIEDRDGSTVAVAADGTLLPGVEAAGVPTVDSDGEIERGRLGAGAARDALAVAAVAPDPLAGRIESIRSREGNAIEASIAGGVIIVFGDASQLPAKWAAAASALAEPSLDGADYIDVSLPDRPAVGGVSGGAKGVDSAPDAEPTPAEAAPLQP